MLTFSPLVLLKPVLFVAGLAAVGMGGYNLTTTGCPLGTCSASRGQSTQAVVSSASDSGRAATVVGQGCARHMVSTPVADTTSGADLNGMDGMGCDMAPGAPMANCPMGNTADASTADASYDHCQGGDGTNCPFNTTNTTDTADDMATVPSDSTAQTSADDSAASEG